jgi:signal transduction histidine kinase
MLVSKISGMQQTVNSKDTYHASMIHELRNPLNAVLGSIGLLRYSKSLTREDQETLNIASVLWGDTYHTHKQCSRWGETPSWKIGT